MDPIAPQGISLSAFRTPLEAPYAHAQGRALAISLSSLTFLTHTIVFALAIHNPGLGRRISCPASYFVLYALCAASASIVGMVGAIRLKSCLVSTYTCVHAAALLFGTLTLINIFVPFDLRNILPLLPDVKFDVGEFCQGIDDSHGWDTKWFDQCRKGLTMVKFGAASTGLILMVAQWWALGRIWDWKNTIDTNDRGRQLQRTDIERQKILIR